MTTDTTKLAERKHCSKCELPKPACACADATAYDNWWEKYALRAQEAHNAD